MKVKKYIAKLTIGVALLLAVAASSSVIADGLGFEFTPQVMAEDCEDATCGG